MLNVSKIQGLITKGENNPSIVSRGTGINYRTLKSKIDSGSWTANDVEVLADFFKKPITYFFDKEELNVAHEPEKDGIKCRECISKQKTIDDLTAERDSFRNKYIECLEELAGKKKAAG